MNTYGDLLKRIAEIIEESSKEVNENPKALSNVTYVNHHYIKNEYLKEWQELLDFEQVFYSLTSDSNVTQKNKDLITYCKNHASIDEGYLMVKQILESSLGELASNLKEVYGYFVPKKCYAQFLDVTKRLKIGPFQRLSELSSEENKAFFNNELNKRREQEKRINKYLASLIKESDEQKIIPSEYKYEDMLFLGINGLLTLEMLRAYKSKLSEAEFDDLLLNLYSYQIISKEELEQLREVEKLEVKDINNLNDLINFLLDKQNINAEALQLLIPYIGIDAYRYLLLELTNYGLLDESVYLEEIVNNKDSNHTRN